jgi:hypothetical protein
VRGHVAGDPGICVFPPDAADVVAALEQDEVLDTLPFEGDRGGYPAEPRSDDGH